MNNPEYTETQINKQLALVQGDFEVHVSWNGEEPDERGFIFNVYLYGDDTPFFVEDLGYAFEVIERTGDSRYCSVGSASNFGELARVIMLDVESALSDGTIIVEEF